ncbi:hypothetical protein AVEN_63093-1 [Araneus ventricosus]|uniref:Uncharacterized protein n=1 Tax=Araneus ventricosus TaxID=182803 RepID=A0A4Y2U0C9_ARAVE|nr:hypothetical protein AVEN_63093-1 [Araneus ventricosus]
MELVRIDVYCMRAFQLAVVPSELRPLDFFMWDLVKDCMHQRPYADMQELKHHITAAIDSIAPQMLANTCVKLSIAWAYNTQPRDITSIFNNFCSSIIKPKPKLTNLLILFETRNDQLGVVPKMISYKSEHAKNFSEIAFAEIDDALSTECSKIKSQKRQPYEGDF